MKDRLRLDEALADKGWTAAPNEQKGDFGALPPAVVLDVGTGAWEQAGLPLTKK